MVNRQDALKDNHERFHLWFFSTLHELPGDELPRQNHSQIPDFRYRSGQLITGIEHTEIKMRSLAELKGFHRGIVREAERLATDKGLPPLHVKVLFHDHFYPYPNKGKQAADALLDTIQRDLERILKMETGYPVRIDPPSPFPGILMVSAAPRTYSKPSLAHHRWEVMEPGLETIGFANELQDTIAAKNTKIDEYLKACDRCWLLVVADRTKADQKFHFTPEMQEKVYESNFERTFYLEVAERFVTELTTKRGKLIHRKRGPFDGQLQKDCPIG
jgi:hypothetical protein